jgi:hypothetical protein
MREKAETLQRFGGNFLQNAGWPNRNGDSGHTGQPANRLDYGWNSEALRGSVELGGGSTDFGVLQCFLGFPPAADR